MRMVRGAPRIDAIRSMASTTCSPFDALVDVDLQSLAGVGIDNRQGTQPTAIEQSIRNEGHRPYFVWGQRDSLSLALSGTDVPTRPLEP